MTGLYPEPGPEPELEIESGEEGEEGEEGKDRDEQGDEDEFMMGFEVVDDDDGVEYLPGTYLPSVLWISSS